MILDILITEAERWQMLTWPVFGQNKTNMGAGNQNRKTFKDI